jgi:hypothetical protein
VSVGLRPWYPDRSLLSAKLRTSAGAVRRWTVVLEGLNGVVPPAL